MQSSTSISKPIKLITVTLAVHGARMRERKGAYRILVGKPERSKPLARSRGRWVVYIKTEIQ